MTHLPPTSDDRAIWDMWESQFRLPVATVADEVRLWRVRQTLADPAGDHDWVIEASVDLDASDGVGEAVVLATALRRL